VERPRGAGRAAELQAAGYGVVPQQAAAKLEACLEAVEPGCDLAWGNIDSYLIWRLTGGAAHVTDRSQAWPTGYLDLMSFGWNEALIRLQGVERCAFPTLVDTWGVLGTTAPRALGAAVPIAADVADQQAALIGHDAEAAGAGKVTFGTSGTLDVSTGAQFSYLGPSLPPFVLSSVGGENRFCVEGMVISAGSALDWLRRTLRLGDHRRFDQLARSVADAGGAWFLPALQGLGAPHGDLARRGALGGLSLAVGPAQIARAAMEGLAWRVREAFEAIYAGTGLPRPEALKVDGGLTASDALMQIQADALGLPVARHAHREATACGAAIAAGRGVGLLTPADTARFARYERVFEPVVSADAAEAGFAAWKRLAYGEAV
jgi:glycerol kinase